MQDLSTGELKPLAAEFFKDIPKLPPEQFAQRLAAAESALQKAKDAAIPNRENQGPIFWVGQILDIKGGKFQVTQIEPGHLRLKSLPSKCSCPSS